MWRDEVGLVMYGGIRRALCHEAQRSGPLDGPAKLIAERLENVDVPGREREGRTAAATKRLRATFDKAETYSPIAPIGPTFAEYLETWMRAAVASDGPALALNGVDCGGRPATPVEKLATAFPYGVVLELCDGPPTQVRVALLTELVAATEARAKIGRMRAAAAASLVAVVSGVGAATGIVVEYGFNPSDLASAGTGFGAAATTLATGAAVRAVRNRRSPREAALVAIVYRWVADFLSYVLGSDVEANEEVAQALARAMTREFERTSRRLVETEPLDPPSSLIEDLSERLIVRAGESGDEDMLAALWRLEDALVRWQRNGESAEARSAVYAPLTHLIDLLSAIPKEEEREVTPEQAL
jgi:hypothetical protein